MEDGASPDVHRSSISEARPIEAITSTREQLQLQEPTEEDKDDFWCYLPIKLVLQVVVVMWVMLKMIGEGQGMLVTIGKDKCSLR